MKKLKPLNQNDYNIKIIEDLGMEGIKPNRVRFAIFECPTCKTGFKTRTAQVKTGVGKGFLNECRSCANSRRATTHGDSGTDLHNKWIKMISRVTLDCYKEHYGNVEVCEDWKTYGNFKSWAEANGYKKELELDRKNTAGNYEPSNCRFVSRFTQAQNISMKRNNTSGYRGVSKLRNRYRARITVNKKVIYLGVYDTALEAAKAFDKYVLENSLEHNTNESLGTLPTKLQLGRLPSNLKQDSENISVN